MGIGKVIKKASNPLGLGKGGSSKGGMAPGPLAGKSPRSWRATGGPLGPAAPTIPTAAKTGMAKSGVKPTIKKVR